jgi:hypothetical protein
MLILKNMYYILILALSLNDFKLDYSVLSKSLKCTEKNIETYYKEIGCKFSKKEGGKSGCYVEFEAPLKLHFDDGKYGTNRDK